MSDPNASAPAPVQTVSPALAASVSVVCGGCGEHIATLIPVKPVLGSFHCPCCGNDFGVRCGYPEEPAASE